MTQFTIHAPLDYAATRSYTKWNIPGHLTNFSEKVLSMGKSVHFTDGKTYKHIASCSLSIKCAQIILLLGLCTAPANRYLPTYITRYLQWIPSSTFFYAKHTFLTLATIKCLNRLVYNYEITSDQEQVQTLIRELNAANEERMQLRTELQDGKESQKSVAGTQHTPPSRKAKAVEQQSPNARLRDVTKENAQLRIGLVRAKQTKGELEEAQTLRDQLRQSNELRALYEKNQRAIITQIEYAHSEEVKNLNEKIRQLEEHTLSEESIRASEEKIRELEKQLVALQEAQSKLETAQQQKEDALSRITKLETQLADFERIQEEKAQALEEIAKLEKTIEEQQTQIKSLIEQNEKELEQTKLLTDELERTSSPSLLSTSTQTTGTTDEQEVLSAKITELETSLEKLQNQLEQAHQVLVIATEHKSGWVQPVSSYLRANEIPFKQIN